jgi:hypothetical protein
MVDLDQIVFYHGPSRPPFSTSAKSVPHNHGPAHVPRYFQHPAGLGFRPGPCEVLPGQSPPPTGTTHGRNIFDLELNHAYDPTRFEMTKHVKTPVTTNTLAAHDVLLNCGSSALAFSEPVLSTDSVKTSSCPAGPDPSGYIPPDIQGDDISGKLPQHIMIMISHYPLIV